MVDPGRIPGCDGWVSQRGLLHSQDLEPDTLLKRYQAAYHLNQPHLISNAWFWFVVFGLQVLGQSSSYYRPWNFKQEQMESLHSYSSRRV